MIIIFTFSSLAVNAFDRYSLVIERKGLPIKQQVASFWSGEYPRPVIHVDIQNLNGSTTITGYESLRKLDQKKTCTIANGVYHPWSKMNKSLIHFYTLAPSLDFRLLKNDTENIFQFRDEEVDKTPAKKNDQVLNVFYGSEGWSVGTLVSKGRKSREVYFFSGSDEDIKGLVEIKAGSQESVYEQWLHLRCSEGYDIFVEDIDLLSQDKNTIKEGEILEWGTVDDPK